MTSLRSLLTLLLSTTPVTAQAPDIPEPDRHIQTLEFVEDLSAEVADRLLDFADVLRARDFEAARGWFAAGFAGQGLGRLKTTSEEPLAFGVGARVPILRLEDAEGREKTFDPARADGDGKLYLALWASWCSACVGEMPALERLHAGAEAKVVAISLDAKARSADAERLLRKRGASYPCWYAGDAREEIAKLVELDRLVLPTTLVLSRDGTILEVIQCALR